MDWSVVHLLNGVLVRHDGVEDVTVAYERAAEFLFPALLVLLFFAIRGRAAVDVRSGVVAAVPAAACALVVTAVLSRLADRPRPFVTHPGVHTFLAHAADPGFPSDHATGAFAIAVAVALRSRRWGAVLLALAALVALGRVALGVHYPTDVLAGACIGAAVAGLLSRGPARRATDTAARRVGERITVRQPAVTA
jgi:undecaprenyl-diphosphatase